MSIAETMAFLAATPERAREIVAGLSPNELAFHPRGPEWTTNGHHREWSLLQHVWHLHDLELEAYGVRLETFRDGEQPFFPDWDGERAAELRDYDRQALAPALEGFESARGRSVAIATTRVDAATPWLATMEGVGPITLERLLQMMRDHDAGHLEAMQKLRQHLRQRNA